MKVNIFRKESEERLILLKHYQFQEFNYLNIYEVDDKNIETRFNNIHRKKLDLGNLDFKYYYVSIMNGYELPILDSFITELNFKSSSNIELLKYITFYYRDFVKEFSYCCLSDFLEDNLLDFIED